VESVKRIRNQRGLSQRELAKRAGLNTVTLVRLEKGVGSPQVDTLEKLAEALGVPIVAFFAEESADPKETAPSQPDKPATGSETEKLGLLETYSAGILEIVEGLDPVNNQLDRVAVRFLEASILEITRVLTEKSADRNTPLVASMRDLQEAVGEEVEVLGVATPEKPPRGESKQSQTKEAHETSREA
jgi:transcriptional regulator with XRE-family HTH domain